jgi:rSAM/selenodomain-associated transferase 1
MSPSTPPRSETLLGMFAKHWQPGKVKTRLARTLGESHAAMLHGLFVFALVERFSGVADRRQIAFTPTACERAFAGVAKGRWELTPQADGDLGQRMEHFLAQSVEAADRIVLIGSDSPDLPRDILDEAFEALHQHDVVVGPTLDGGYYLLGLARRLPPIFAGIAWSTPDVWTQTTERLQSAGIAWHKLPQWYDVDEEADLRSLVDRLQATQALEPRLAQLQRELGTLLGPNLRRPVRTSH